jgi:hypothetical protein
MTDRQVSHSRGDVPHESILLHTGRHTCPALQMPFRQAGTAHLGLDKRQASVLLVEVRAEVPFLTYGCNAFKSIHSRPVDEALGPATETMMLRVTVSNTSRKVDPIIGDIMRQERASGQSPRECFSADEMSPQKWCMSP